MKSLNGLLELLRTWIEDDSIDDSFTTFLNFAVLEVEDMVEWASLYGEEVITVGSDGILTIPPKAYKLTGIYSTIIQAGRPEFRFQPRDNQPTSESGGLVMYSYNPYIPVEESLAYDEGVITQGLTTITGTGFDSDWIGERLMIGDFDDLYEITAVNVAGTEITVNTKIPFASGTYDLIIRPAGMERYKLLKSDELAFSGDVKVTYQRRHPTLVGASDRLLIPAPRTVSLLGLKNALITDKYTVDATRLEDAMMVAKNSEISNHAFHKTKNVRNDRLFSVRSNRSSRVRYGQN